MINLIYLNRFFMYIKNLFKIDYIKEYDDNYISGPFFKD